jgi:hypothetical protein
MTSRPCEFRCLRPILNAPDEFVRELDRYVEEHGQRVPSTISDLTGLGMRGPILRLIDELIWNEYAEVEVAVAFLRAFVYCPVGYAAQDTTKAAIFSFYMKNFPSEKLIEIFDSFFPVRDPEGNAMSNADMLVFLGSILPKDMIQEIMLAIYPYDDFPP